MSVRYAEPGSTWWPVLWAPAFCLAGAGVEALSGPVHVFAWVVVGIVLTLMAAGWVNARRKVCAVELTDETLRQGPQTLPVERIAGLGEGDGTGAPVLGGGLAVPRKTTEIPLTLDDGSTVLAWAKYPGRMRAALTTVLGARSEDQ
ncbi:MULTISPECIES: hypothetical protein [Actinokineospora]|uniref:Uncharacterized protein n=1 Tax=Actinokineospora fastidiosa TaxID=1816 RepID=A0A918L8Y4_9PSEU|nr:MULTISPECIES: hypothetical protein [Actinokineospora]UVS82298.1 hypothetical protein Actkin_06067 [Actinokineospora sp. UTMC 2448]GGS22210.1 hypothetical protein GCM10010171_13800 [Actinokineospora fastidiosa]